MRKSCLECVLKHLGSAAVYIEEVEMGYPNYFGYAYGELVHASSECLEANRELAMVIREHRIKWSKTRTDEHPHQIPFEALFSFIDTLSALGDADVEIPDDVKAGLDTDTDGSMVFSMDTRP